MECPSNNDRRTFILALASALGIGTGGGIKPSQLEEKIKRALGIGLISRIVVDEAHNLWPADLSAAKPVRIEFLRELRDGLGVGSVLLSTEQFALSMELALKNNTRWAPGQFMGRQSQFCLRETHTDAEIRSIARLHAGAIESAALDGLVSFAKAQEGYLGAMVEALKIARGDAGAGPLTAAHIATATRQQQHDERIVALAASARPLRHGRFAVVRRAA